MKLFLIIALLTSLNSIAQDSIAVKVIEKPYQVVDTIWYKVLVHHIDGKKEKVWAQCCCPDRPRRKKGEMVMIAKKDLIIE